MADAGTKRWVVELRKGSNEVYSVRQLNVGGEMCGYVVEATIAEFAIRKARAERFSQLQDGSESPER